MGVVWVAGVFTAWWGPCNFPWGLWLCFLDRRRCHFLWSNTTHRRGLALGGPVIRGLRRSKPIKHFGTSERLNEHSGFCSFLLELYIGMKLGMNMMMFFWVGNDTWGKGWLWNCPQETSKKYSDHHPELLAWLLPTSTMSEHPTIFDELGKFRAQNIMLGHVWSYWIFTVTLGAGINLVPYP